MRQFVLKELIGGLGLERKVADCSSQVGRIKAPPEYFDALVPWTFASAGISVFNDFDQPPVLQG